MTSLLSTLLYQHLDSLDQTRILMVYHANVVLTELVAVWRGSASLNDMYTSSCIWFVGGGTSDWPL